MMGVGSPSPSDCRKKAASQLRMSQSIDVEERADHDLKSFSQRVDCRLSCCRIGPHGLCRDGFRRSVPLARCHVFPA